MENLLWLILLVLLLLAWWGLRRLRAACRAANHADWGRPFMNFLDGFNRLYCRRVHDLPEVWLDIPDTGPAVVVSNHVSGLDPLLLFAAGRRPLHFLIAREQYGRRGLTWLFKAAGCIPVDRQRRPERALREALKTLEEGKVVALFPHGKIHLDSDPPRKLKPGAVKLALHSGAPLVPARISGVRGEGHVLPALLLPGPVELTPLPPLDPRGLEAREILDRLSAMLDGKARSSAR